MKVNDLTIGQAKELASLFSKKVLEETEEENNDTNSILKNAIGKYCIVRTRNEGINAGKVIEADSTGVVIEDARRIYYHKPKDSSVSWYEGVATSGLSSDSKISGTVSLKYIIEDYSLTICSLEAEKSIRDYVATTS